MTYAEFFAEIKGRFMEADVSDIKEHLAYQLLYQRRRRVVFYVEVKDGTLHVEPYEYFDRDALFICSAQTLRELADGTLDPVLAFTIQKLKVDYLKSKNPRLHTDEVLIALSASAATSQDARLALEQLPALEGCQAHTSVMLSDVDIKIFKKLGVQLTCEAVYEAGSRYH